MKTLMAITLALAGSLLFGCPNLPQGKPEAKCVDDCKMHASKCDDDGRWPLETCYPGKMPVEIDEGEGRPSRWNNAPS